MAEKKMKFPKTIGKIADMLYKNKVEITEAMKVVNELKAKKVLIEDHIINEFPKSKIRGAMGDLGKIELKNKVRYSSDNDDDFHKYVTKNKAWDMLTKSLSQKAIRDRLEDGEKLPFIKAYDQVVISCTKAS